MGPSPIQIYIRTKLEEKLTMQVEQFARKPFHVDAVRVTNENMSEVAEWCNGTLNGSHIKVEVTRPMNERQTKAFAGDWVLKTPNGSLKVYTDKAFHQSFVPTKVEELRVVEEVAP